MCRRGAGKRTLQVLGEIFAAADPALSAQGVFDRLVARERLGSTGLGGGCALPHARVPDLGRPLAAFLRLRKGVDFDSPDNEPVDLVFALLVPDESTDEHLEIVAAIARVFSDAQVRSSIRFGRGAGADTQGPRQQRRLRLSRRDSPRRAAQVGTAPAVRQSVRGQRSFSGRWSPTSEDSRHQPQHFGQRHQPDCHRGAARGPIRGRRSCR